jgi:uncharacterized repeat protein (TIGR01451 family)
LSADPKLGPLQGSPGYHPLLYDSPAINGGNPDGCIGGTGPLSTDQRGFLRFGRCDIGAYEAQSFKTVNPSRATPGDSVTYTIALQNGSITSADFGLTDTMPITLTYASDSLTTTSGYYGYAAGVITWTGSISPGAAVSITFRAAISRTGPYSTSIINSFVVNGTGEAITRSTSLHIPPMQVFLPCIFRDYCPDFIDDFGNPASGWKVGEDGYVRAEYLNGEFRVLTKQWSYFYSFQAPTCKRQNYIVETNARWVGTPGNRYGVMLGITPAPDQYYLFVVNTDHQQYWLLRRDPGGFSTLASGDSLAIQMGTTSNHLKATRSGNNITLEVNGTVLGTWTDGMISGMTGVGLVSNPYSNIPVSDARFDNFSFTMLPGN